MDLNWCCAFITILTFLYSSTNCASSQPVAERWLHDSIQELKCAVSVEWWTYPTERRKVYNCTTSVVHLHTPCTCIIAIVDINTNLIEITCISDVTEWLLYSECHPWGLLWLCWWWERKLRHQGYMFVRLNYRVKSFPERVINPALRWQYKEAERNYRFWRR